MAFIESFPHLTPCDQRELNDLFSACVGIVVSIGVGKSRLQAVSETFSDGLITSLFQFCIKHGKDIERDELVATINSVADPQIDAIFMRDLARMLDPPPPPPPAASIPQSSAQTQCDCLSFCACGV